MHLQEPMAFLTNLSVSFVCFFAFFKLKKCTDKASVYWQRFFVIFGISTVFGALGHLFFQYFGIPGKFPCWIIGCIGNIYIALGMLHFEGYSKPKPISVQLILVKTFVLLACGIYTQKFLFIAIDAGLTYVVYTGIIGYILIKRGAIGLKSVVIGVVVLLPSLIIFTCKINIHRWLNKDDLSHILMVACLIFFYLGMKAWGKNASTLKNV